MPYTQVLTVSSSSPRSSTVINSTKIRVTANAAVHFAVGVNPTANTTSCELIPPNVTRYINMEGLGNKISIIGSVQTAELSITRVGNVFPSGQVTSSDTYIPS